MCVRNMEEQAAQDYILRELEVTRTDRVKTLPLILKDWFYLIFEARDPFYCELMIAEYNNIIQMTCKYVSSYLLFQAGFFFFLPQSVTRLLKYRCEALCMGWTLLVSLRFLSYCHLNQHYILNLFN